MAGLNDKYFLADDSLEPKANPAVTVKAFKENQDGEEAPELRDDIDLIAAATEELSIELRGLELFRERIGTEGGISQSIALEALELLPNLVNDEQPIGCFTKYPSKTMYSVALEEADEKGKGLLEKFRQFVVAMFKRVVDWFKSFLNKDAAKTLATKENTALLQNAKATFAETKAAADKVTTDSEEIAKAIAAKMAEVRKKEIEEGRAAIAEAAYQAKLDKLSEYINSLQAEQLDNNVYVGELNSILGNLPNVRKFLAHIKDVNPILFNHENTTSELNTLLHDIKQIIDKGDYEGLKKFLEDGRFTKVKDTAHQHAMAIVEFKSLSAEYKVESFDKFWQSVSEVGMLSTMTYGVTITSTGLAECEATAKNMEEIESAIERLASYKYNDKDGNAKAFLEELREFNRFVVMPAVQRISFSFSVVSELVKFLKSLSQINNTIEKSLGTKIRQRILMKAKELGFTPEEANRYAPPAAFVPATEAFTEFTTAMAKEAAALESIFTEETGYYRAVSDGGSIGFESNEPAADGNKKNIIRRMIDAITGFISRLLKRIKDYFFVNEEEQKKNAEFAKNYKGPTDEDLAKAVNKNTAKNAKAGSTTDAPKPTGDTLKDALDRAEHVTGQRMDINKAKEFFNGEKMALITAMLGRDRLAVITAMLSDKFNDDYATLIDSAKKYLYKNHTGDPVTATALTGEISNYVKHCNTIIQGSSGESDQLLRTNLAKWVMGKDSSAVDRIHSYFIGDESVHNLANYAKSQLDNLQKYVSDLANETSDEAVESLKHFQQQIQIITAFITLEMKMDNAYSTVLKGLGK